MLSTGKWVKIHVDSSAIYKIDHPTLKEYGFDNPDKVYLYGYGSVENAHSLDSAPSDLPALPIMRTSDGIIFYGEGDMRVLPASSNTPGLPIRNYYSRGSYYFLSDVKPSVIPEIETLTYTPAAGATPLSSHIHIDFRKPEEFNVHNAGVFFYSVDLSQGIVKKYNFPITDYDSGGYFGFRYAGRTTETGKKIGISLSSDVRTGSFTLSALPRISDENTLYNISSKAFSATPVSNTIKGFTAKFFSPGTNDFDFLAVDYLYYTYNRRNIFRAPGIRMEFYNTTATPTLSISGAPADLTLWDVTSPRSPISLIPEIDPITGNALASLATSGGASRIYAFSPAAQLPVPSFSGEATDPALHTLGDIDFLIVTVPAYHEEALRLAQAHKDFQGIKATVVNQEDIFNEFSSGAPHPNAIRKFAGMLYRQSGKPLRYLLLLGCGTYDNRRITIKDDIDYLITYEVEHLDNAASNAKDYCSDQYFGMFTDRIPDNLGSTMIPVSIGVGRIPALNISEVRDYVDKCIAYLSDPTIAGDYHHALLISDYGDNNDHMMNGAESSASAIKSVLPGATLTRLYEALYPHTDRRSAAIQDALKHKVASGPRIINYTGHADINSIGSNIILSTATEKRLNYGSFPLLFLATCRTLPVDNSYRGIASQMLLKSSGAIAAIGSAREVYINYNHNFNDEFLRQYYGSAEGDCIGDVYRRTYNVSSDVSARRINNLCYNLAGNPALPVHTPSYGISITNPATPAISLTPLTSAKLSGTITDADGKTVSDFNGTLTLRLYAPPASIKSYQHVGGDTPEPIELDESLLTQCLVNVTAGEWNAELFLPATAPEGKSRLTCTAISPEARKLAAGTVTGINILPAPKISPEVDNVPPEITLCLDSGTSSENVEIGASPCLHVAISDSGSGVDLDLRTIGSAPSVMLDGNRRLSDATQLFTPSDDRGATLSYKLSDLSDGEHTICVTARDNAGNSASETITFTVINSDTDISLSIDKPIIREYAEFDISHTLTSTPHTRLVILDMAGNTVFSKSDVSFPFRWDLTDLTGNKVPDGTYRASAIVNSHPRFASSPEMTFSVVKHLTKLKDQ